MEFHTEYRTVNIDPSSEFTVSGVEIAPGDQFFLHINGFIDLCPDANAALRPEAAMFPLSPKTPGWQELPVKINAERATELSVSGTYGDINGTLEGGRGLYFVITAAGEEPPGENDDFFTGGPEFGDDHTFFGGDENYEFFEYYTATRETGGVLSLSLPFEARLYARYALNNSVRTPLNREFDKESPWRGIYQWSEQCENCIELSQIDYPGNPCKEYGEDSEKCFTDDAGEHWIEDDYALTSGGYVVKIRSSCPRNNGENIEVMLVPESGNYEKRKQFAGTSVRCYNDSPLCTGGTGANIAPEGGGTPFVAGEPFMGGPVNRAGFMTEPATANGGGFFAFKIIDTLQKPSDLIARGNCVAEGGAEPACCMLNDWPADEADRIAATLDSGELCGDIAPGNVCTRYDPECIPAPGFTGHADNVGKYTATIGVVRQPKVNRFLNHVLDPINALLFGDCGSDEPAGYDGLCDDGAPPADTGLTRKMYEAFAQADGYTGLIMLLATLSVVVFGFYYMLSLGSVEATEMAYFVLRLGIVFILLSPDSWDILYTYLFSAFLGGTEQLMSALQSGVMEQVFSASAAAPAGDEIPDVQGPLSGSFPGYSPEEPFDFIYYTFYWLFDGDNVKHFVMVILVQKFVGLIFFMMFLATAFAYFLMVLKLAVVYITAKIYIAFLITLAPLYFLFLLFRLTRSVFVSYLKLLAAFMIQPVFAMVPVVIVNAIFFAMMYQVMNQNPCARCIISLVTFFDFIFQGIADAFGVGAVMDFFLDWGRGICVFGAYSPDIPGDGLTDLIFLMTVMAFITVAGSNIMDWLTRLTGSVITGSGHIGLGEAMKVVDPLASAGKKPFAVMAAWSSKKAGDAIGNKMDAGLRRLMGGRGAQTSKTQRRGGPQ